MLVRQGVCSLTVSLVGAVIDVFDDLHIVNDREVLARQPLARYVAYADEYVLAPLRVRDSPDQLWLRVTQGNLSPIPDAVERDSSHGRAMTHVLGREVQGGDRVREPRLYHLLEGERLRHFELLF